MSADLEARVSAGLEQIAATMAPAKPPADELLMRQVTLIAPERTARPRGWRVGAVAAAIAIAIAAASVVALTVARDRDRAPTGPAQSTPRSVVSAPTVTTPPVTAHPPTTTTPPSPIDAEPRVVTEIPTSRGRGRLAFDGVRVWLAGTHDNTLIGIDPATRQTVTTFEGMPGPYVTTGAGGVFVCGLGGTVRVDPATGETVARSAQKCRSAIAFGAGSIWIGNDRGLVRLDAETLVEQAVVPDLFVSEGIEFAAGSIWVPGRPRQFGERGSAARVDPGTNTVVATIETPDQPRLFEEAPDGIWVSFWPLDEQRTGLVRINPDTNEIELRAEQLPCDCWDMAIVGPNIVVGNYGEPLLVVDRATGALVDVVDPDPDAQTTPEITSFVWDGALLWMHLDRNQMSGKRAAIVAIDLGRFAPA